MPVEERPIAPETSPVTPEAHKGAETVTNAFGDSIPVKEAHIYAGEDVAHTYVFGDTPAEHAKEILKHLMKNPNGVVIGTDNTGTYRIPWHMVEGEVLPGTPMRTSGFFGFGSTWMAPPGPDDLRQLIK